MLNEIRLGRVVWYRSKTGAYSCPALITATVDTLFRPNVDAGHLPDLADEHHVHLTVFTPGLQGHASASTADAHPELVDPARPNLPAGGSFQEFDIPFWASPGDGWDYPDQPAGTWTWPRRDIDASQVSTSPAR